MTIIAPHVLKNYSIPFSKITQEPGEFMITFPFAYHAGFNHGFNCAESTNFALPRWVEYGKRSSQCTCRNDCVKICMDVFVRKFQPEKYDQWKAGKDYGYHPEDPTRYYAAPPPNKLELALSVRRQEEKKKPKDKVKQRRQPVTRLKGKMVVKTESKIPDESTDTETEKPDDESLKLPKKKKARRNPPVKKCDEIICEKSVLISEVDTKLDIKSEEPDNPPELKPFWHPEGDKIKVESVPKDENMKEESVPKDENMKEESVPKDENMKEESVPKDESMLLDEETVITSSICYQSELEIIDKFPQLKNAISLGSLSLKILDGNNKNEDIQTDLNSNKVLNADVFSQNWRCEQVKNSLKIKLVSPKPHQQNYLQSPPDFSKMSINECSVSFAPEDFSIEETNPTSDSLPAKSDSKENPDSEKDSNTKVKRAANTTDNWAHHLIGLWQHENFDFEIECSYNQKLTTIPPHCAVCVLFTPLLEKDSFTSECNTVPSSSKVRMPTFCFGDSLNNECILDGNLLLQNDGNAPLLKCCVCKVCVHAPCYGITELPDSSWTCNRCLSEDLDVQCCLCVLRGGALKPTTDGRWAHIVCAVLITETYFENAALKEPINVSNITQNRMRLKCKYCIRAHAHKDRRGVCVQCQSGKCYLPFHVTCGYMAGVKFESNDWPEPINMICTKHSGPRRKPMARKFTNVSVGESVIAKHRNRRYYWANVKEKYVQEYYSILFEDNSHSTNTLPEDIVSKDVSVYGPPKINEKVKVKWTDGKIYNGLFKGSQSVDMFVVEFDDGTIQHQERRQIFAADEDLPKEVQSKMSHSSEGKGLDVTDAAGKRLRLANSKYFSV